MISQLLVVVLLPALNDAAPVDRAELDRAIVVLRKVTPDHQEGGRPRLETTCGRVRRSIADPAGGDGWGSAVMRNWLRSSIDQVLADAKKEKKDLPYPDLELFIRDRTHDPQARRLAYELVAEHDKTTADRFLPKCSTIQAPNCGASRRPGARTRGKGFRRRQETRCLAAFPKSFDFRTRHQSDQ